MIISVDDVLNLPAGVRLDEVEILLLVEAGFTFGALVRFFAG